MVVSSVMLVSGLAVLPPNQVPDLFRKVCVACDALKQALFSGCFWMHSAHSGVCVCVCRSDLPLRRFQMQTAVS